MKISDLLSEIVVMAEEKYGVSSHNNDVISVGICCIVNSYVRPWQVWLQRPTQNQLDRGEISGSKLKTIKVEESETRFLTSQNESLIDALCELKETIRQSRDWND